MNKLIFSMAILANILGIGSRLDACSGIFLRTSDQMVFGRNHDYYNPNSVIIFNPSRIQKSGMPYPGEIIPRWKSKHSSITISLTGVGFANSGMNEKGLAIGHMALHSAYPERDERPVIDETQWIQYMLDICATTDEVIEEAQKIRIARARGSGNHYFMADAGGETAIIEFLNGRMIVYRDEDMPHKALCNDPYAKSMDDLKDYAGFGGRELRPKKAKAFDSSYPKEVMAIGCAKMMEFYQKEKPDLIREAFRIHYAMSGPETVQDGKAVGTQYTTVFDLSNRKLYFRTLQNGNIREVDFSRLKDDGSSKVKMLDILTPGTGDVTGMFIDYSAEENLNVLRRAYSTETNQPSRHALEMHQQYADSFYRDE